MRQHAPEYRQHSRRLLVELPVRLHRQLLEVIERLEGRDRHRGGCGLSVYGLPWYHDPVPGLQAVPLSRVGNGRE